MPSGEAPTGERPEMPSGEAPTGERPEMPSGEAPTGEKPNMKGGNAGRGEQNRPEMGMKGINTDSMKTSIEALEDEDTKTALETLLSEYESAKTALDTAIKEKSDDVDTLREAEMKAMEALRTALEEAGIDARPQLPEGEGNGDTGMGQRPEKPADDDGSDMPSEKPAMQQSGAANNGTNSASDNIFTRFGNWFMSLFSR
jgi:hypothetical protein